jgi:hypothetical protein
MKLKESTDNPILWWNEKNMTCCNTPVKFKFSKKDLEWSGTCQTCQTTWTMAVSTFQIIKTK